MRSMIGLVALGCLACASSQTPTIERPPSPPAAIIPAGSSTEVRLSRDDRALEDVIQVSREEAWTAARALYHSLGVPLNSEDRRQGLIATGLFTAPRRLFDQPLGRYLDCGHSLAGARVTIWQVKLELATAVRAESEGTTRIGTLVTAHARPLDGSSVAPVACSSTGQLEREIARRIREGVGS